MVRLRGERSTERLGREAREEAQRPRWPELASGWACRLVGSWACRLFGGKERGYLTRNRVLAPAHREEAPAAPPPSLWTLWFCGSVVCACGPSVAKAAQQIPG